MESVNFVHDVNTLRKTMKSVYSTSEDLRALNTEIGGGPGNSRVQVLPVCWRHLLDFPRKREKKHEQDIGLASNEEDEYPSLDDLTIEGAGFARSLISDLALDVLLYQSAYREQISEIVFREANRIYNLFIERNPNFKGKVHIVGHSLGSASMYLTLITFYVCPVNLFVQSSSTFSVARARRKNRHKSERTPSEYGPPRQTTR